MPGEAGDGVIRGRPKGGWSKGLEARGSLGQTTPDMQAIDISSIYLYFACT